MSPAATRLAAFGILALCAGEPTGRGAESPATRTTPTRPAVPAPRPSALSLPNGSHALLPLPATRINGIDYVNVSDVAKRLALKLEWSEPGKKLTLADAANRATIEADGREAAVNGLRIFLGDPARARGGQVFVSRIDAERCLTPLLRPGLGVAPPPPPKIIALDPGHGGRFAGTENERLHLQEKDLVLDVSLRLKKILEAAGCQVVMTRTKDVELAPDRETDLALRAEIANRARADLFVSIHLNSLPNDTRTSGSEIYTFAPQHQRSSNSWGSGKDDAEATASPANRCDHWSVVLAQAVHRNVLATLKTFDRGKKINQLGALRRLECPGVLVESAFLSNDAEAKRVATPVFRQQIAEAVAAGIRDYAATLDALRPKAPPPTFGTPTK